MLFLKMLFAYRYLRRISAVFAIPTSSNLPPIVPGLSSQAVIPFPLVAMALAVAESAFFWDDVKNVPQTENGMMDSKWNEFIILFGFQFCHK